MTPKDKAGSSDIPKTTGRRPGRPAIITSARQKQERSRQSARECRTRKNLRYQYLEQLVTIKEKSVFKLRHELERHRQWCANLDQGVIPEDLVQMLKLTEDGTESCLIQVPSTQPSSSTIQSVSNAANQHNWTTVALTQPNCSTIQSVSNATKQPNDARTDIVESKSPTRKSKLYSLLTGNYDSTAEASDIHSFKALHVKNSTDIASSSFKRDAEYAQTQLPNISSVTDEQKTSDADIIDWIFQNDSMCSGFQNNQTRLDQIVTKTNMERTIEISRAQIISQHPDFRVDLPDENAFTDILSGTVDNTVSSETYIGSALFAIRDKHLSTTQSYPSQNVCQTGLDIQNVVQSSNNLPAEYLSTQVAVPTLLNSEQMSIHTDIFKTPFSQQFENNIHQDVSTIGIRRRAGSIGSIDSHRPGFHSSNTSDSGNSEQHIQGDTVFSGQCNAAAGFQEYNYVDNSTANTAINIQTCPNSRGVTTIACTSKTYNVIGSNQRPQRSLSDSSKNRYSFQHSGNILNTNSSGIQLQRSCSVQENSGSSTESDKFPFLFSLLKPDKGNM